MLPFLLCSKQRIILKYDIYFIRKFFNHDTYINFDISGPTSVCADGVTTYQYNGASTCLYWGVTGGVITGGWLVATDYVTVKWSSSSGTLWASGQEQNNCWWDDANYPPVLLCDTYHYTSNSFTVSPTVVVGGTISGAATNLCELNSESNTERPDGFSD